MNNEHTHLKKKTPNPPHTPNKKINQPTMKQPNL